MTIVVFLGPTMSWSEARRIMPDAVYLPPAAQADIISAVDTLPASGVLLIDGVFTQQLSVWHKEILYALERGIPVYGASSMGALRIAETAAFGSRGFGQIYRAFADGELTDDDEVAVMHAGPDDAFRALSDAMVNIRSTLRAALDAGAVTAEQHDSLVQLAKDRFYPERSYPALLSDAAATGFPDAVLSTLQTFIRSHAVDQKRQDAIELLTYVAEHGLEPPDPIRVTRSHPFEVLYHRDRRVRRHGTDLPLADIGAYAALHLPDFPALNEHALDAGLVDVLAEVFMVEPDEAAVAEELTRFRTERRLRTDEDVVAWRSDSDLNEADFDVLIRRLATRRALRNWYISRKYLERTTEEILNELRLRDRYPAVADAAATQETMLNAAHPDYTSRGNDTELLEAVRDQARAVGWRPTVDLAVWAFENGFKDVYDVRFELIRAKLAREAASDAVAALISTPAAELS